MKSKSNDLTLFLYMYYMGWFISKHMNKYKLYYNKNEEHEGNKTYKMALNRFRLIWFYSEGKIFSNQLTNSFRINVIIRLKRLS